MRGAYDDQIEGVVFDVDGVLTDGTLFYGIEGEALKAFSARDGMGMAMLRESGIRMAIVSGRESPVVEARAQSLGVAPVEMGRMDKATALVEIARDWDLALGRIAVIGDDLVDIPMFRKAGLSAAPADADPRVRERADLVLEANGGRGAVREFCEIILRRRGLWKGLLRQFGLEAGQ